MDSAEVVVVGGGVMGCAVALRLAEAGRSCLVLERSVPGAEASSAAAGILAPCVEHPTSGILQDLGVRSREAYVGLAEKLREHGIDIGFRRCGALVVALDEGEDGVEFRVRELENAGVAVERLTAQEARELEPELSPRVRRALRLPEEAQLDPRLLMRGLAVASERAGVRFRTGLNVRGIEADSAGGCRVRVDGGHVDAGIVVVAAGSWTGRIDGTGLPAEAVLPIRGQVIASEARSPLVRHVVFGPGAYVVPRADGRMLCGSTEEAVGFERKVTLGGVASIAQAVSTMVPALGDAPVCDLWCNFRPATADGMPLIGYAPTPGVILATGHFRSGILLAPQTAEMVHSLVNGEASLPPEVDPRRFTGGRC